MKGVGLGQDVWCGISGAVPMPIASPEAPPSMEAAFTSKASSRALPGWALDPPALCTPALIVANPTYSAEQFAVSS